MLSNQKLETMTLLVSTKTLYSIGAIPIENFLFDFIIGEYIYHCRMTNVKPHNEKYLCIFSYWRGLGDESNSGGCGD